MIITYSGQYGNSEYYPEMEIVILTATNAYFWDSFWIGSGVRFVGFDPDGDHRVCCVSRASVKCLDGGGTGISESPVEYLVQIC